MPDTIGWQDIAFSSLKCDYSNSSSLVLQVKIFFRGRLNLLLKDFPPPPVLTLGLDKQKENKSVIIYCNLKLLMVNLQVERKQGLKDTEFMIHQRNWYFVFKMD